MINLFLIRVFLSMAFCRFATQTVDIPFICCFSRDQVLELVGHHS